MADLSRALSPMPPVRALRSIVRPASPLSVAAIIRQVVAADSNEAAHEALTVGVRAGIVGPETALAVARGVAAGTRAARRGEDLIARTREGDTEARYTLTTLAVLLAVPVATWTRWMGRLGPRRCDLPTILSHWAIAWSLLPPTAWTPGRIAQASAVLAAGTRRLPHGVSAALARAWMGGEGPMADRLKAEAPTAVFAAIRRGASPDTPVRSLDRILADPAPLVACPEIRRLIQEGRWGGRSVAERCAVLARCRFDRAGDDGRSALKELVCLILMHEDEGVVPAFRALVQAQGTVPARAMAVAWLTELSSTGERLARDPVVLAHCAEEMTRVPAAAGAEPLVALVLQGWQNVPDALWGRAVAQMLRQRAREDVYAEAVAEIHEALRHWWAARAHPRAAVDPTLATECLASRDPDLVAWALLQLVPHVAADASKTPARRPARGRAS